MFLLFQNWSTDVVVGLVIEWKPGAVLFSSSFIFQQGGTMRVALVYAGSESLISTILHCCKV